MKKSSERLFAFLFGVVFIIVLLTLAILFPEPKPFQWNVFKTVLALSVAGIVVFLPGFLNVNFNNIVRASGALGAFVVVFFFNPANLVTDYDEVKSKYDLLAFNLGRELCSTEIVLNQTTVGDSLSIAETKKAAYERLDLVQNSVGQLGVNINLKQLFTVTSSANNVFPQTKYDYIENALDEKYGDRIVNHFSIGWYLTWLFIQTNIVMADDAPKNIISERQKFLSLYPDVAAIVNEDLEALDFRERIHSTFVNLQTTNSELSNIKTVVTNKLRQKD